jgi:voltage-dependent calcium channel T type alpha-1G
MLIFTVAHALYHIGDLSILFGLLFFIFAILGTEMFGELSCDIMKQECEGLSRHANFKNIGMSMLTLFRVATGDNWSGIMASVLDNPLLCNSTANNQIEIESSNNTGRGLFGNRDNGEEMFQLCAYSIFTPVYFFLFIIIAQYVLLNIIVSVLMKYLNVVIINFYFILKKKAQKKLNK